MQPVNSNWSLLRITQLLRKGFIKADKLGKFTGRILIFGNRQIWEESGNRRKPMVHARCPRPFICGYLLLIVVFRIRGVEDAGLN